MKNWAWVWGNPKLSCSKALHRDRMLMECLYTFLVTFDVLLNQDNPACHDMEFCVIHRKLCIKTPPSNAVGSSTMIWFHQHFQLLGCTQS